MRCTQVISASVILFLRHPFFLSVYRGGSSYSNGKNDKSASAVARRSTIPLAPGIRIKREMDHLKQLQYSPHHLRMSKLEDLTWKQDRTTTSKLCHHRHGIYEILYEDAPLGLPYWTRLFCILHNTSPVAAHTTTLLKEIFALEPFTLTAYILSAGWGGISSAINIYFITVLFNLVSISMSSSILTRCICHRLKAALRTERLNQGHIAWLLSFGLCVL